MIVALVDEALLVEVEPNLIVLHSLETFYVAVILTISFFRTGLHVAARYRWKSLRLRLHHRHLLLLAVLTLLKRELLLHESVRNRVLNSFAYLNVAEEDGALEMCDEDALDLFSDAGFVSSIHQVQGEVFLLETCTAKVANQIHRGLCRKL